MKTEFESSPVTGHKCFLGKLCDLWYRTDSVTITCGSAIADNMETLPEPILVRYTHTCAGE